VSNSKTALRLATGEKDRSPERAALAHAIEVFNANKATVDTLQSAVSFARDGIRAARSVADKAEAALEAVKQARAEHLVFQAKKGEPPSVQNTSRERAEFQVALDEVEVAFSAEANLSAELATAQGKLTFSESQLKARVLDVIKSDPETRDFLSSFGNLERRYLRAKAFLTQLPTFHPEDKYALIGNTNLNLNDAERPWRDWAQALQSDADAPFVNE
jgi:hypothetical protein